MEPTKNGSTHWEAWSCRMGSGCLLGSSGRCFIQDTWSESSTRVKQNPPDELGDQGPHPGKGSRTGKNQIMPPGKFLVAQRAAG